MTELSPTTKALLRAAREDRPSAAGRAQIWSSVATNSAGGTALGGGATAGKVASVATAKLFVMGALLGSAVTVGVAAMVLGVGAPKLQPDPALTVHAEAETEMLTPAAHTTAAPLADERAGRGAGKSAPRARGELGNRGAGHPRAVADSLGREAELVEEARGAVMRGEAQAALSALSAAQALPAHALEPEELSLEVKALRALGRLDEANAADARLKAQFPDHALAR